MAVFATETAVRGVKDKILAYLPAELAVIDSEKADGLVLDQPTAAQVLEYAVEQHSMGDGDLLIEVFTEESRITEWYAAELGGQITLDQDVSVRVTIANREAEVPQLLARRCWRTVAGLLRVLSLDHFDLDQTVEASEPTSITYRNFSGDLIAKQATINFTVRTREQNT